ncbi:MAG: polyphosphate kinase 2 family protein [Geminicoccaceae bacterium]|nr:polyphosphate kinase 2 family protein [Geminicoccaceae bacterium]
MKIGEKLIKPFAVSSGKDFCLSSVPTDGRDELKIDRDAAEKMLELGIERLSAMQERLYAENRQSLLLVFQAMDAAGKDSTIKRVMSGVNPQGCQVFAFKAPSAEELDHDYMWRCVRHLPERGRIGIFNRSYYEEVLAVRVNPQLLENQRLPVNLAEDGDLFEKRYQDIRNFEDYLRRQGTRVIKFFLNVSKAKQKERFLERLDDPQKHWKFSPSDLESRESWDDYMKAYEDMIKATATKHAPWHVVPADRKWLTRVIVIAAIVTALEDLDPQYPDVSPEFKDKIEAYRSALKNK